MKIKQKSAKQTTAVAEGDAAALDAFCRRRGKPRAAVLRRLVREAVPELRRRYDAAFAAQEKKISQKNTHDE